MKHIFLHRAIYSLLVVMWSILVFSSCQKEEEKKAIKLNKADSLAFVNLKDFYIKKVYDNKFNIPDTALYYSKLLQQLLLSHGDTIGFLAEKHFVASQILISMNKPLQAAEEMEAFLEVMKGRKDMVKKPNPYFLMNIGNLYYDLKLYPVAVDNYLRIFSDFYPVNYNSRFDYLSNPSFLTKHTKGIVTFKPIGRTEYIHLYPVTFNNIGLCLREMKNYQGAIECFYQSYMIRNHVLKDSILMAHSLRYIGETYLQQNKLSEARYYLFKSYNLVMDSTLNLNFRNEHLAAIKSEIVLDITKLLALENKEDSMDLFASKLLTHLKKNKSNLLLAKAYLEIADKYIGLKRYKDASYLLNLYETTEGLGKSDDNNLTFFELNYRLYRLAGDLNNARKWELYYLREKNRVNSRPLDDIISLASESLQAQNNLLLERQKEQLLQKEKIISQEQTIKNFTFALLGLVAIGFIIAIVFFSQLNKDRKLIFKQNNERALLIREIHHRVKNNLTVISGILNLQQREIKDEKLMNVFRDAISRVSSMALVHKNLYEQDDFGKANIQNYFENMYVSIFEGYKPEQGKTIDFKLHTNSIHLDVDTLVPLALIVNELLTNSFKYAFKNLQKGVISIEISQDENGYQLSYFDNGPGLPENYNLETATSLGISLINGLTSQLEGKVKILNDNGLTFIIDFKPMNNQ